MSGAWSMTVLNRDAVSQRTLTPCCRIAARSVVVLRRRSPELAFWVWAGVSFLPISQLFPFLYPMADPYLMIDTFAPR